MVRFGVRVSGLDGRDIKMYEPGKTASTPSAVTGLRPLRAARRFASLAAVALALALGAIPATTSPAAAATDLGGVSVANYCARNVWSGTLAPSIATNINNRWDGWRCATRVSLVQVDMNLACRQQYPKRWFWQSNAYAGNPSKTMFGWRCYR